MSVVVSVAAAMVILTSQVAFAVSLSGQKYGGCTKVITPPGATYATAPHVSYSETGDSFSSTRLTIGPSTGYANSEADAGVQCVPDPQPNGKAWKITTTNIYMIWGRSISCSTGVIISWPSGLAHTCSSSSNVVTLTISGSTCSNGSTGVYKCPLQVGRFSITSANGSSMYSYCREVQGKFVGSGNANSGTAYVTSQAGLYDCDAW
jgi:hypothetical protein